MKDENVGLAGLKRTFGMQRDLRWLKNGAVNWLLIQMTKVSVLATELSTIIV